MIIKSMRKKMLGILIVCLIIGSILTFSEKVSAYTGCITVHPNPIDIFTHNLTGTRTIFFWSNESMEEVNVTVCNSQKESYVNEEVYQDYYTWGDFNWTLANATYNKTVLISNCSMFDVHIWGDQDCPDLDLGIFLDGKDENPPDGVAQKDELVGYDADADADEEVRIMEPVDGLYIIKVFGFTVTGYPGHFDMDVVTIFIQPGIFAVQDIPSGSLPPYALGAFNLTWNLSETSKDDIYLGALYIGTESAPKNILVPITLLLDRIPPKVSSIIPLHTETNVSLTTNIVMIFNDTMNTTSVEEAFTYTDGSRIWGKNDGIISWNDMYVTNDTMVFDPMLDLRSNTTYTFSLSGSIAQDLSGNPFDGNCDGIGGDNYYWKFTTRDILPPQVSHTFPSNEESNVSLFADIVIIFDENMNITSVENTLTFTDNITIWNKNNGTFTWSDNNKTMSFKPTNKLAYNTIYYVTIGATAKDTAGNYLDGDKDGIGGDDYTWSFTTEIGTGTIYGTVKNRNGNPISNVTITVYYTNGTVVGITTTDENGDYMLEIAPGIYDIKIEKSGYEIQWEKGVEVTADEITTANIAITPTFHIEEFLWLILPIAMIIIAIIIVVALKVKKKKPSNEIEEKAKEEELEKAEDEEKRTENNNE